MQERARARARARAGTRPARQGSRESLSARLAVGATERTFESLRYVPGGPTADGSRRQQAPVHISNAAAAATQAAACNLPWLPAPRRSCGQSLRGRWRPSAPPAAAPDCWGPAAGVEVGWGGVGQGGAGWGWHRKGGMRTHRIHVSYFQANGQCTLPAGLAASTMIVQLTPSHPTSHHTAPSD